MKRQNSSDEGEGECSRPAKTNRLDLNATPRGFDLNAPVPEEDYGQGGDWSSAETKAPDVASSSLDASSGQRELLNQQLETAASLGIDEDLDLLQSIWTAFSQKNFKLIDEILVTLCEEIAKAPSAPTKYPFLTCIYVAKKVAVAFRLPKTFKALLSFLDPNGPGSSLKKQNLLPVYSCKLLFRAFAEEVDWPIDFVKAYLEDAMTARNWVDGEPCREFVANVITAFRDNTQDIAAGTEDAQGLFDISKSELAQTPMVVKNRYPQTEVREKAKLEFLEAVNQLLKSPSSRENPRMLFRFFTLGICYEEVRVQASSMVEVWLNHPIHFRGAKLLLDRLIQHTHDTTSGDYETVRNLLSLKLNNQGVSQMKTSANILYTDIVHQMVQKRPEYLSAALKTLLFAESNLKGILTVLKAIPDSTSPERELSVVIKELLYEDCGTRLQDAVLRLTKHLSKDVSAFVLCRILLEPWPPLKEQPESVRVLWFKQVTSLACLLLVQSMAFYATDEKFVLALDNGEQAQNDVYDDNLKEISSRVLKFQIDALAWCTEVMSIYIRDATFFSASVRMLMFLEDKEVYQLQNGDVDLNCFHLVAYSAHASEEILARVILMGISNLFPMTQEDALETIEKLVWRAVASRKHMIGTLSAESIQLPAAISKLSAFTSANLTRQPSSQVVLKDMYWRCCLVLVALAVFNTSTIGKYVWESFPTMKILLEHLITENTLSSPSCEEDPSDIEAEESVEAFLQNEVNEVGPSSVKGNVMIQTNSRKPPKEILEELTAIDEIYSLGRTLRTCKTPNFVGDMILSLDFKQAGKWIRKVICKEPEVLRMLPYEWQCKLLYIYELSSLQEGSGALIHEFQQNLRKLVNEDTASSEFDAVVVIKTFSQKLVSESCIVRSGGRRCLSGIFGQAADSSGDVGASDDSCTPWLEAIDKLKPANVVLIPCVEQALINETSIPVISSYVFYLETHVTVASLAYTCACFLVKRKIMARSLLLSKHSVSADKDVTDIFLKGFSKVHELSDWNESQFPLVKLVSPQTGGAVSVKVPGIILEAMLELLSISSASEAHRSKDTYAQVMKLLFPGYVNADGDMSMAFLESEGGESQTILSREQATQLVRTKDMRLIRAGLSKLNLFEKINILKDLGLSLQAKESILKELEELSESSARELLASLSSWQRKSLCGCFPELTSGSSFAKALSEYRRPAVKASEVPDSPCTQSFSQERSSKEVIKSTLEDLETAENEDRMDENISKESYISSRSLLQQSALEVGGKLLDWVRKTLTEISSTRRSHWLDVPALILPVLMLLHRNAASRGTDDISEMQLQTLTRWSSGVSQQADTSALLSACSKKMKQLEKELAETLKREVSSHMEVDDVEKLLSSVPLELEKSVRGVLLQKFEGCLGSNEFSSQPLVQNILASLKDNQPQENTSDESFRIEMAGRDALLAGIVSCLDPSFRQETDMLLPSTCLQFVVQNNTQDHNLWKRILKRVTVADGKQLAQIILEPLSAYWSKRTRLILDETDSTLLLTSLALASSASNENGDMPVSVEYIANALSSHEVMERLIRQLVLSSQNPDTKEAVRALICSMYIAYPVTVGTLLKSNVDLRPPLSFMPAKIKASRFYRQVRNAIASIFSGPGNSAAYGFCYYVATNHPVFMILHFPTLKLSLLEIQDEHRARLASLLVFTVELLVMVRPYLLDIQSFSQLADQVYVDVESLVVHYFQVLERVPDKALLGKFAIQLADFLFHSLGSGGRLSELVYSTRELAQPAFQRFAQARKVSLLMDRLRVPSASPVTDSDAYMDRAAFEKMERVKSQLAHYTTLQQSGMADEWNILDTQALESSESLFTALNDLEQAASHFPGVLSDTEHMLVSFFKADDPDVSEKACSLLERLLKRDSRSSRTVAGAIVEKLGSNERSQVEIAARHAGKLFHFCEELQESILVHMFRAGKPVAGRLLSLLCETVEITRQS